MQIVPIASVPNQSLSIVLDNNFYDIALQQVAGILAVTISRNSVVIVSGVRAVAGSLIIPYQYLQDGNFFFQTAELALPSYDQFNITQNLIYLSVSDIEQIASVPPTFQQYGAFPLRYIDLGTFIEGSDYLETESGEEITTEGGSAILPDIG